MLSIRTSIGLLLALTTVGAATAAAQADTPADKELVEEAAWVPSDSAVMDKVWFLFIEEPQKQMSSTLAHLSQSEQDEAARTVLTTAAYLRLETLRAHGDELSQLQSAIAELDHLAEQISLGDVTEPAQVGKPFGDALLALAQFHYGQAMRARDRLDNLQFGQELQAAAAVLDYGMTNNFRGSDPAVLADIGQAHQLADQLINGLEVKPESDYNGLMGRLGRDIELLARFERKA